ncbi:MAG TPA: nuclear transport factor 2 family protein [Thermoanaerobaculia bacterium]|jgi:hypothetical protein|nr:nuclear transport factor 2 family protein [Thermoanaerobaculia bacterium]
MPSKPYKCLPLDEHNLKQWKTPEGFEAWHADIWKFKVKPRNFGPQVFTKGCVMEGPRPHDRLVGNIGAGRFFQGLFLAYPNLSGEHVSWACNDNQVFFNWCFVTTGAKDPANVVKVAVMDVFCIDQGLVAYRLTEFDMNTLQSALDQAYPRLRPGVRGIRGVPPQERVPIGYLWTRLHQEGPAPTVRPLR